MNSPGDTQRTAVSDEALLRRVQQENQRQILGKLLHDLRNPIHSLRITMALFGRLARREGDVDTLAERAAAYIGPAETALANLLLTCERLGNYLGTPAAPALGPLPVRPWLDEIVLLLHASRRALQVTVSADTDPALQLVADRPRLSHAALQCCLGSDASRVTLGARAESDQGVRIDVSFESTGAPEQRADRAQQSFTAEELRILIKNAGGTFAAAADGGLSMSFRRPA